MKRIEEALRDKKAEIDNMEAPAETELLLKQALKGRKRRIGYRPVAAALIAALILTYNFDVLAYYGKKFTGYDRITIGALSRLNEEGRGQEIGKSCSFGNGTEVTIDGIMYDENKLVVFYKMQSSGGKLEDILQTSLPRLHIYGLKPMGYYSTGGQGTLVNDRTMTFVDTMEPPMFYEKWLRIDIEMIINGAYEVHSVNFTLDRGRAMEKTASLKLGAEATIEDYRILFDEFNASAMSSLLKGRIIPLTDEALGRFDPETVEGSMEMPRLRFDIVSDAGEVIQLSGGQSASGGNITFTGGGDALPEDFKTLQIRNIRMETMKLVDKAVDVSEGTKDMLVTEDLIINSVYSEGNELHMSVSSRGIPVMGLFSGGEQLEQINADEFELAAESSEPAKRVYRFRMQPEAAGSSEKDLELDIKYIRYTNISSDTVNIPVD